VVADGGTVQLSSYLCDSGCSSATDDGDDGDDDDEWISI
jgi:hypothetical protein